MEIRYMPIGEIPQCTLDANRDEFGMEILHLPKRDVLVITADLERYCPSCDNYVDPVIEIGITWASDDSPTECSWNEIGEAFCPNTRCQETYFADSPEHAADQARESYYADRADAIRKGEW